MSDLNFSCTQCGKCCHDLRLPLTRLEAIRWLEQGGTVEILCEAIPWVDEPAASDAPAMHKRLRSFPALSGELPIRVIVVLAASFKGACPHLLPDMRCGNYDGRPHVCRIYPAEVNPFISVIPSHKQCPAEAWASPTPFIRANQVVDAQTQLHTTLLRHGDRHDVPFKAWACAQLNIQSASLSNEGFVSHQPSRDTLLDVLRQDMPDDDATVSPTSWTVVTNQATTLDALRMVGAKSLFATVLNQESPQYLGFLADTPATEPPACKGDGGS
ncbi:YkgJ family cysteine cluster protein [Dyella sp. 2HG41-7]|uniref:YkgJ family cysteine cluster protein n=1 Tax=Dyella sp. 2HG41-7 TaxID=2883239 RepID=UPI001F44822E|nr:YkgJ family cysteine cluster protein [Dyella sp. 2HG41-7]